MLKTQIRSKIYVKICHYKQWLQTNSRSKDELFRKRKYSVSFKLFPFKSDLVWASEICEECVHTDNTMVTKQQRHFMKALFIKLISVTCFVFDTKV